MSLPHQYGAYIEKMSRGCKDCRPFPSELGPTPTAEVRAEFTAPRPSSQEEMVDFDSTDSIDSSTERATAIPMSSGTESRMGYLRLVDSRSSNNSMPSATPTPPNSSNNSPKTRQKSGGSVRSQTPHEDRNGSSANLSSLLVSAPPCPLKGTCTAVSQSPLIPPAAETASNKVRIVTNSASS